MRSYLAIWIYFLFKGLEDQKFLALSRYFSNSFSLSHGSFQGAKVVSGANHSCRFRTQFRSKVNMALTCGVLSKCRANTSGAQKLNSYASNAFELDSSYLIVCSFKRHLVFHSRRVTGCQKLGRHLKLFHGSPQVCDVVV